MKMVQEQPHGRTDRAEEAGSQGKWFPAWAPTCGVTAFMWCSPPPAGPAGCFSSSSSSLFFSIPYPVLLLSLPFSFYSFSSPPPTALIPLIIPPPHPPSSLSSCSSTLLAVFSELGVPPGASASQTFCLSS